MNNTNSVLKSNRVPLIVDSDEEFIASILNDKISLKVPPVFAKSGRDAQIIISDVNRSFSGIFINPEISTPGIVSIIRCAHQFHPAMPLFLLYKHASPYTEQELKSLGIQKAVSKEFKYEEIVKLVSPLISSFEMENALAVAQKNKDVLGAEVTEEDAQFISIRAEDFVAGTKVFFDVYVRLSSGKYIKILNGGDSFSADRVIVYLKKGVVNFYLRKEAQEFYLAFCDKLAESLIKSGSVSTEIKVVKTLNHGEETLKFFKMNGVSDSNLEYAKRFISNVTDVVKQLSLDKEKVFIEFLDDLLMYEHGASTAMIASMLMTSMRITSADPVETVGLACLFHDIGLKQMSKKFSTEDESEMTEEEKKVFYNHPLESSEILSRSSKIKPAAIQAVAQHHERRTRKGFPFHLGPGSISMVSEIIGISDEFFRIVEKAKNNPKIKIVDEIEAKIVKSFSMVLVEEFKSVFKFTK